MGFEDNGFAERFPLLCNDTADGSVVGSTRLPVDIEACDSFVTTLDAGKAFNFFVKGGSKLGVVAAAACVIEGVDVDGVENIEAFLLSATTGGGSI